MSFIRLDKSNSISVGDKVCIKRDYASYSLGRVGQVVEIFRNKPYMTKSCKLGPKDFTAKKTREGGVSFKIKKIPDKRCTMSLVPAKTSFVLDFSGKGKPGYGSIHLERKEIAKVPNYTRINTIHIKCLV